MGAGPAVRSSLNASLDAHGARARVVLDEHEPPCNGSSTSAALDTHSGYDGEVRHLLSALASGSRQLDATLEDSLVHTRVIEAERKSLGVRQPVMVRR